MYYLTEEFNPPVLRIRATPPPPFAFQVQAADIALALLGYLNRTVSSSDTKNQQTTSRPESQRSHHNRATNYPYEADVRISTYNTTTLCTGCSATCAPRFPFHVHLTSPSRRILNRRYPMESCSSDLNSVAVVRSFWTLTYLLLPRASSLDALFILFFQRTTYDQDTANARIQPLGGGDTQAAPAPLAK
ncbi:hypothetical protein CPAR01_13660 [Colletotrichum paranaense]|uniref:Uncharacterized protein n=1 Tax=Colletotrichum paranaense TaxID=1914294 RepID=A0ABQ9S410_9PEZI|nr:uncharacterized protein CPAR01_13660 [Colletotrichum paranaense]KAK1524712.1 hypothetical protein CPAR01_13660 [Colletotrichum paranaense]